MPIPQVRNSNEKAKVVSSRHKRSKRIPRASNSVTIKFTKTELLIVHDLALKEIDSNPKNNVEELLDIELKTS